MRASPGAFYLNVEDTRLFGLGPQDFPTLLEVIDELATGKSEVPEKLPAGTTPTQLAAYTVVSRVLLNLDETITKE